MPGLVDMFLNATVFGQIVLIILFFMSIGSWAIIIRKYLALNAARKKAAKGLARFMDARDLREAVQTLGGDDSSPLYRVAERGVAEFNRLKDAGNSPEVVAENVYRSLLQGITETVTSLSASLPFLATTSNTGPLLGLFGTVWGLMAALQEIAQHKSATIAQVAPGIAEALITTAFGLFVAVPAMFGYNIFTGKMSDIESDLNNFAGVFLNRVQREINAPPQAKPRG